MFVLQTRILVTHGITYLPKMDKIVVIKDGEISESGSYKDLIEQNGAFAEFIRTYLQETAEDDEIDEEGTFCIEGFICICIWEFEEFLL